MAASNKTNHGDPPPGVHRQISLEVSNLRLRGKVLEVQLRADREPDKPRWWAVTRPEDEDDDGAGAAAAAQFKAISEALEKNRPVYAEVTAEGGFLTISAISIHYSDTNR